MNFYVPTYSSFFETQVPRSSSSVEEDSQSYYIQLDTPGIKIEDLKITTQKNLLNIEGERKGHFAQTLKKSFSLPDDVDADKILAKLKDGVLELVLPKKEKEKPRIIPLHEGNESLFKK